MENSFEQLRREMRADFELTWGAQRDLGNRLAALVDTSNRQAELSQQQAELLKQQAELLGQALEASRRAEGRIRQQNQRFDGFLGAIADEYVSRSDLVDFEARFEQRLSALEERESA